MSRNDSEVYRRVEANEMLKLAKHMAMTKFEHKEDQGFIADAVVRNPGSLHPQEQVGQVHLSGSTGRGSRYAPVEQTRK